MKYKNIFLAATACMLALSAGAGSAWAYFTTYTEASGGYQIQLGSQSTATETLDSWTKHVTVTNDAGSAPVFVRVKAFSGSQYGLTYSSEGGRWEAGEEGYYYYNEILPAGGETEALDIKIDGVPADIEDPASFNVVVVYESAPVCYSEDGEPYADWSMALVYDTAGDGTTEGGVAE